MTAGLPATYAALKTALANCERVDECRDMADKAMALAAYAKQANDDEMLHAMRRIQARALKRAGELLLEVESARGANLPNAAGRDGPAPIGIVATAEESQNGASHCEDG